MDDILERVPPQNLEAEQSVLGAVLLDNGALDRSLEVMNPDDFYREIHRDVFSAMLDLAAGKAAIDPVTLRDSLRARGKFEAIGGSAYIARFAQCVPTAANVEHYARIVHEKAVLRRISELGHRLITDAYEAPGEWSVDRTEEVLAGAEHDLAEIAGGAVRRPDPNKAKVLKSALWRIEHRASGGIATGLKPIDENFGGFLGGETTMLGGRTSQGKTALALNIAINAAKQKVPVAFFTLEMPAEQMHLRAVGTLARVNMFDASRYGYRAGEKEKCAAAAATLESIPLEIIYRPRLQPRGLRLECKRLMREANGLKLAIIDYVGLMRGNHRERERWNEMREVIIALKDLAGELGIPLVLLSQLSRECGTNERPELSHLRDTGTAEEHASNVLFIYQPNKSTMDAGGYEEYDLVIAKQRNGPAGGRIPLRFKKAWGIFSE